VAFHEITAPGIAIDLNGTIVLIKNLAIFGADGNGQVKPFEVVKLIHCVCIFSAKIEFF
jgi:hypothetical protein